VLEKPELLKEDPLASEISARQRYDWRPRANLPIDDPDVRAAVMELSNKIAAAIARTEPSITATSGVKRERDAAFKEASEAVKRQEPQRTERRDQKRILWVDDRPNNNVVERKAMEAYNIEFTLALSTGDALAKLRGNRFDAIISDMSRPQDARAGYTLLQALRESGDNTPYFIYAGPRSSDPKSVREAKDRGAQGSTDRPSELIDGVLRSVGVAS
jgi:CheY-like chemotaxis protein